MDAKEFLREYGSMCNKFEYCDDCPLSNLKEMYNTPDKSCNKCKEEFWLEEIK